MRETIDLTGMVLKSMSVGESDRRLVILTRERGRIFAFARGAKRPKSQLMAPSRPFAFGKFCLYEGRNAYNVRSADISNYFPELSADMESACYGSYFLELADYYGREGIDGTQMLLLLYQSLRALLKPSIPNTLVRLVYELRTLVANGEYTETPPRPCSDSASYAWGYILSAPIESLYTFVLKPEVEQELRENVEVIKKHFLDRDFHSLEVLQMMAE